MPESTRREFLLLATAWRTRRRTCALAGHPSRRLTFWGVARNRPERRLAARCCRRTNPRAIEGVHAAYADQISVAAGGHDSVSRQQHASVRGSEIARLGTDVDSPGR